MDAALPGEPALMGRYELGELLGRGGMGEIYAGLDRVLGRRVAIKMLPGGKGSGDSELTQRLRSEARAAASIEHPNVVRVHDLTITDTTIFVVMEYLEGESLRTRLGREHVLPLDQAVRIGADVCLALAAAHQAGVIHRDIGPGNIMLCKDGTVRVMDFGIARIADSGVQTEPGRVMGTPAYVSPEQVAGADVDHRCDLYSLGCTLYHMVTGSPPFTGSSPVEVAWQHRHATPRPPRTRVADIPEALDAVIVKALAKSAEERFPDALQMRAELLAVLGPTPDGNGSSLAADASPATSADTASSPGDEAGPGSETPEATDALESTDAMDPADPSDPDEQRPAPPARYRPPRHLQMALLNGVDLGNALTDRRRWWLGITLVILALVMLTVAFVGLRP